MNSSITFPNILQAKIATSMKQPKTVTSQITEYSRACNATSLIVANTPKTSMAKGKTTIVPVSLRYKHYFEFILPKLFVINYIVMYRKQ